MIGRLMAALAVLAGLAIACLAACVATSLLWPTVLLFPHERRVGETTVYAEAPIPDDIEAVIRRSEARLRGSALFNPRALRGSVFITRGGWRWQVLAVGAPKAFALTRPLGESLIVNRADIARDRVWSGGPVVGERVLSDVIAHERTHTLIRLRFGLLADRLYPAWLREGYCDHVAGSSTLTDQQAARLVSEGRKTPALFYYQSRKRVERALRDNGGSVEALFASPPSAAPQ